MAAIREILVIPHIHHDVGYTHLPSVCLEAHTTSVARALDLAETFRFDSSPEAFRWTFELSRPVLQYLRQASHRDADRLRALIAEDRVAVTAGYLHMSQILGHEDAIRALAPVREMRERFGISPTIVQHGDINGLPWGTVPLMASAGLETLVMALNPDHGRAPFEQPSVFYWEGPDQSRILVWLSVHYAFGHLSSGDLEEAIRDVPSLLARLQERTDYPFDFLVLHAAMDNVWPDPRLLNSVRQWNDAGHTPSMRVVTIEQVIRRVQQTIGNANIPVWRGEWADWWAHGHGSTACEVGLGRQAQTDLRLAETCHALATSARLGAPVAAPRQDTEGAPPEVRWYTAPVPATRLTSWTDRLQQAYDELLLWDEHTWGTHESVLHPFSQFTQSHWNETAGFGYRAHAGARSLRREALGALSNTLPESQENSLVVVNPLSRSRDDVVSIETASGTVTRLVRDLPPLGVKVIPQREELSRQTQIEPNRRAVLENAFYRLEVDPAVASIVSLVDAAGSREWVDANAITGVGGIVYEEADSKDRHPALTVNRRHFHPNTPGPRFLRTAAIGTGAAPVQIQNADSTTLIYESSGPTMPLIRTSITLHDEIDWIDLSVMLHKTDNLQMEGVHILFPFALQTPTFWLQSTNTVYRPGIDQLPDTCLDWFSVQHGAGIDDGEVGVLWATREAPLVQLGGFHTGDWSREFHPATGHLHSWLMNNLYFTNFKASQSGEMTFSYRFRTVREAVDTASVWGWGEEFGAPASCVIAPVNEGTYRWLDIAPATVSAQVASPVSLNDLMTLRLRETAGQTVDTSIEWTGGGSISLAAMNVLGRNSNRQIDGDGTRFHIQLQPFELVSLAVQPR